MDTIFRNYRSKKGEVWQLGWYRALFWAEDESGQPFRPCILDCLSVRTDRLQSAAPGTGEPQPPAFRDLVTQAARAWRLRPERIEVTDARLAEDLRGFLAAEKVPVELRTDLPELRTLQEARVRSMRTLLPPDALAAPGLTVERLAAFARAAARFAEAAPWRQLQFQDLLVLESSGLPEELRYARVVGPPHETVSLLFGPEEDLVDGAEWEEEEWDTDACDDGSWKVSLVPACDLPPEDVELWLEHGLPLAHSGAYPLALRTGLEGTERPDARLLSWFEAILDALASTTEEEMDTGLWEKEVVTSDGPVRLALSLPDVLEPPDTDLLAFEDDGDVPREVRLAAELADEADESWGRRQIHLARRAVALWPDCIEGWLVLARRAPDPESARSLYAEAVAAGERLIPGIGEGEAGALDENEWPWFLPWIWARLGLAKSLWSLGAREEAVGHLQTILAVDPGDPERIRGLLAHALLSLGRNDEAGDLLTRYAEETADWRYTRALLTFRQEGDSAISRRQMAVALETDRHVARQLLGLAPLEEDEEESHAVLFRDVWADTPGALEALRAQSAASAAVVKARKAKRKGKKKQRRR